MKQNELYSYVYDFISQLLDNEVIFGSIRQIILFGSVVRGDFRKESDVDLFIDLEDIKERKTINDLVKKELNKFETRSENSWALRGIDLPIKVVVGNLDQEKWKELKEEILSYGKILYGKFKELPGELQHQILVSYEISKLSQKQKMSFLRKLYGYVSKKGSKNYVHKGLIDEIHGEKVGPNNLIINADELIRLKSLFKEYKIKYQLREVWSK